MAINQLSLKLEMRVPSRTRILISPVPKTILTLEGREIIMGNSIILITYILTYPISLQPGKAKTNKKITRKLKVTGYRYVVNCVYLSIVVKSADLYLWKPYIRRVTPLAGDL